MPKSFTHDPDREDVFTRITNSIMAAIEAGTDTYEMPWNRLGTDSSVPVNAESRKPYRGINVLQLWAEAELKGYSSNVWATYKQWTELGAQVRKGEKSSCIVFWKFFDGKEKESDSEETSASSHAMARAYAVFNAAQVDGWKGNDIPAPEKSEAERIAEAETFFKATGAKVIEGGDRACYVPFRDEIRMPRFDQFQVASRFYSVLAHEVGHWTGHASRLNREEAFGKRFGSESYAMEKLVAELSSAFVSAQLGLEVEPRTDHAPYIANWLKVLKSDKRAIFTAAAKAQQAVDFLTERVSAYSLAA